MESLHVKYNLSVDSISWGDISFFFLHPIAVDLDVINPNLFVCVSLTVEIWNLIPSNGMSILFRVIFFKEQVWHFFVLWSGGFYMESIFWRFFCAYKIETISIYLLTYEYAWTFNRLSDFEFVHCLIITRFNKCERVRL